MLLIDRNAAALADSGGRRFDPTSRAWLPGRALPEAAAVGLQDAVRWLQRESGRPLRTPIGVIGPRDATPEQLRAAEAIGAGLAGMGLSIVCGGRQGVMEAACRGANAHGGLSMGLLPELDASHANPFVTIPIATGIGEARNALVARSAFCLIAIGNSYGTLSEVALGLQFGKRVFGIAGAADVEGVSHAEDVELLLDGVAQLVLCLPGRNRRKYLLRRPTGLKSRRR